MDDKCFSLVCNKCGCIFPADTNSIEFNEYSDSEENTQAFNLISCPDCSIVDVFYIE